jgi:hypothetical protein
MESVIYFVEEKLKLKVNRDKSAVDRPWNRKIPGFSFLSNKQATIRLAPKTISRFKEKVRELTDRSWSISMEEPNRATESLHTGLAGLLQTGCSEETSATV